MQVQEQKSGGAVAGIVVLLPIAIAAAVGIGLLLWAIERYLSIYLVGAFPLFAGAIAGAVIGFIASVFRIRLPVSLVIVALLAGLVMMATYHLASYYLTFREEGRTILTDEMGKAPTDAEIDSFVDAVLQQEVNATGFIGFMQLQAKEGFTISRATSSSSDSGLKLEGNVAWGYWVLEIILAGVMGASVARNRVSKRQMAIA
jgi:hypothetical protein